MKIIGIDPGKNTGIAIYDTEVKQLTDVYSKDFWHAIDLIDCHSRNEDIIVIVELPASKRVYHKGAKTRGAIERTGVNVGSVIREAELIIKRLSSKDIQTVIKRPGGKVNAKNFKEITGWPGVTNQHGRDAGLMCYGFNVDLHVL